MDVNLVIWDFQEHRFVRSPFPLLISQHLRPDVFIGCSFAVLMRRDSSLGIPPLEPDGGQPVPLTGSESLEAGALTSTMIGVGIGTATLPLAGAVVTPPTLGEDLVWPSGGLSTQPPPWARLGPNNIDSLTSHSNADQGPSQVGKKRSRDGEFPPQVHEIMRVARNGREQQRAHKISELIDQLKGVMDNAAFSTLPSSKLHVLNSCEAFVRSLQHRTRCFEMERQLRGTARDVLQPRDVSEDGYGEGDGYGASSDGRSDARGDDGSDDSQGLEDTDAQNGDVNDTLIVPGVIEGQMNRDGGQHSGRIENGGTSPEPSSGGSSSSDGEPGSTDEGATDGSISTSDSAQSGNYACTDSSSGCGSLGSSESGSGDGGSEQDDDPGQGENGSEPRTRAVVMNYFEIFRLSHIPMAIASKDGGQLLGANQALKTFAKKSEQEMLQLKISSLVASESKRELESAIGSMLSTVGKEAPPGSPLAVMAPFSANAGIGDRPALLTLSLVRDERGHPLVFHIALFPTIDKISPAGPHLDAYVCTTNDREHDHGEVLLGYNELTGGSTS
ncbi:unnamed protein product [Choristocarpus tenellus]